MPGYSLNRVSNERGKGKKGLLFNHNVRILGLWVAFSRGRGGRGVGMAKREMWNYTGCLPGYEHDAFRRTSITSGDNTSPPVSGGN